MCLDRICEHFANSEALISRHQGLRYTYGQLKQEVENAARGMISIGVEKGDRVGVWSPNCAEWLIAQYALAKVGAIMVNINPAYRLRELEHALTQSGVSVIVAARGISELQLCRDDRRVGTQAAGIETNGLSRQSSGWVPRLTWDDLIENGKTVPEPELREREAVATMRRSGQYSIHFRDDGQAKGRDVVASQYSEQWLLRRRAASIHFR